MVFRLNRVGTMKSKSWNYPHFQEQFQLFHAIKRNVHIGFAQQRDKL